MREISPTELTKEFREKDLALKDYTYNNARKKLSKAQKLFDNPVLSNINIHLMQESSKCILWIADRILLRIDVDNLITIGVKTRIATGMLYNLNRNHPELYSEDVIQAIHLNLIQSIKWLQTEYIVADLRNSPNELPF